MSMCAKGLSDRDISAMIEDIYGFSLSHETISRIVARVMPRFEAYQRPYDAQYPAVCMLIDTSHELKDGYSTIITVDKQADSVDYALMGLLTREDIVVTQDFGLAAMAIGKGAKAINQSGLVFTDANMDRLLMERHIGQKIRRGGGRTKGPPKRTKEDDARFEAAFERLLRSNKDETGQEIISKSP